jgi:hypothetical protein
MFKKLDYGLYHFKFESVFIYKDIEKEYHNFLLLESKKTTHPRKLRTV